MVVSSQAERLKPHAIDVKRPLDCKPVRREIDPQMTQMGAEFGCI